MARPPCWCSSRSGTTEGTRRKVPSFSRRRPRGRTSEASGGRQRSACTCACGQRCDGWREGATELAHSAARSSRLIHPEAVEGEDELDVNRRSSRVVTRSCRIDRRAVRQAASKAAARSSQSTRAAVGAVGARGKLCLLTTMYSY